MTRNFIRLPVDPDTATKQFYLDGKSIIYAVCPNGKRHQTYKLTLNSNLPILMYPKHCTHKEYLNSAWCREHLTRPWHIKGIDIEVAIKTLVSFNFKDWFAGLLSWPGYQERIGNIWQSKPSEDEIMHNIFDSEYIYNFKVLMDNHLVLEEKKNIMFLVYPLTSSTHTLTSS